MNEFWLSCNLRPFHGADAIAGWSPAAIGVKAIYTSAFVQVFGRRPPQRVEGFVMPASKNLYNNRHPHPEMKA